MEKKSKSQNQQKKSLNKFQKVKKNIQEEQQKDSQKSTQQVSQKSKKINKNLKSKLHVLTYAQTKQGHKLPRSHMINTGSKNQNIWDFSVIQDNKIQSSQQYLESINPLVEEYRYQQSVQLRQYLIKQCQENNVIPPLMIWERWQAACKLQEQQTRKFPQREYFLPDDAKYFDNNLKNDLIRGGISQEKADQIASNMAIKSKELVDNIQNFANKSNKKVDIEIKKYKHSYDVQIKNSKRLLKLNHSHYDKLWELYKFHNLQQTDSKTYDEGFQNALFNMLSRYNSLLGHGMQCALSEYVFDTLKTYLKVNFECFASPLNCRYGSYCSAFPDTDTVFGSQGNFFDFQVSQSGGSFEVNPPFIEIIMSQSIKHINDQFFKNPNVPLSFAVIVPGWIESEAYQLLNQNKFLVQKYIIPANEHGYCSGAQHQRRDRFLDSPYDTVVFILQNANGKITYSIDEIINGVNFEKALRQAFIDSVPTEAMRQRRIKEGRGFGDLDGGGGVYKGKKKNKQQNVKQKTQDDENKKIPFSKKIKKILKEKQKKKKQKNTEKKDD